MSEKMTLQQLCFSLASNNRWLIPQLHVVRVLMIKREILRYILIPITNHEWLDSFWWGAFKKKLFDGRRSKTLSVLDSKEFFEFDTALHRGLIGFIEWVGSVIIRWSPDRHILVIK